jgi:2-hydroxychromene-2-carboxylate isomerase
MGLLQLRLRLNPKRYAVSTVEFWFEFASTYSYPAAMRIEALASAAGVRVAYRPFLLGPIFANQGWNDSPFNLYPAKGQYMWRDLERICAAHGLPLRKPSAFPRGSVLAARVALLGADAAWVPTFVRAIYSANFVQDRDIGSAEVVGDVLRELGCDAESVIAQASEPAIKTRLREQTEAAQARGIFGAPSVLVGDELFWGHDRLEQALAWASGRP